jgi:hypothetical protein
MDNIKKIFENATLDSVESRTEKTIEGIMEKASEEIMQIVEEKLPMLKDDGGEPAEFKKIASDTPKPEPASVPKSEPKRNYKALLEGYLAECERQFSSDLHLKVDNAPCIRLAKELVSISDERLTDEVINGVIESVLTPEKLAQFKAEKKSIFPSASEKNATVQMPTPI